MANRALKVMAVALAVATTSRAWALTPGEVAVVFNSQSQNSLKVAKYYMKVRKIPDMNLIPVNCPAAEAITEEAYRTSFVPQVRKGLADRKLEGTVKCLVTTYDVPLRIFAHQPTLAEQKEIGEYQQGLNGVLDELEKAIPQYDAIARSSASMPATTRAATATAPAATEPRTLQTLITRLNASASKAGQRLDGLTEPAHSAGMRSFIALQESVAGVAGLLNALHVAPDAPANDPGRQKLAELQGALGQLQLQYAALGKTLDKPESRKQVVALRRQGQGLIGEAQALEEMAAYLKPDNTEACLDSELALVFADQTYPRVSWVNNPNHLELYPTIQRQRAARGPGGLGVNGITSALFVARLDGETPDKTIAMIDTTMKVEATGLEGKIYLDARGNHGTDAYAAFDADIRRAADWLKQHSTVDVVLDDNDALFQAKDAPDAALYCGWYSLRNYQDSCQWVAGAVGYHVASYEMSTLHTPGERGWVPNLLNHGFCGTLGATDEPYLNAFPKPSLFFPLLLCGEFTQGEVWEVTNPLLSWRIGYVGDPLYNPYKVKPRVKVADLEAHPVMKNAWAILRDGVVGTRPAAGAASRP